LYVYATAMFMVSNLTEWNKTYCIWTVIFEIFFYIEIH